jgi:hypothetical protein
MLTISNETADLKNKKKVTQVQGPGDKLKNFPKAKSVKEKKKKKTNKQAYIPFSHNVLPKPIPWDHTHFKTAILAM